MKNLFALVGLGTIAFVGLGWYMGWYKLSRQPSSPGNQSFKVDIDPSKIATDGKKFFERVTEITEHLSDGDSKTPDTTNRPSPQISVPANATATGVQSVWKSLEAMPPAPVIQPVSVNPRQ